MSVMVAAARANPLLASSLPPSAAAQLPLLAPVTASAAANVTALPLIATNWKLHVAETAQKPVVPSMVDFSTYCAPTLKSVLWVVGHCWVLLPAGGWMYWKVACKTCE